MFENCVEFAVIEGKRLKISSICIIEGLSLLAPCKVIQDRLCFGIHAGYFGFQVLDTGFFQSVKLEFWIPKTRIPRSTSKNSCFSDSTRKKIALISESGDGDLTIPPFGIFHKRNCSRFLWLSTINSRYVKSK